MMMTEKTEEISCPLCRRYFELPKRYLISQGDYDFKCIPRLLPCLHTVCHSCLEEQRDRDGKGAIKCPICRSCEVIKGVKYLPLDISIMKQLVQANNTEIMSTCGRCYENVPSFSWCLTCSSALCEFHHQDHRLSMDTARHLLYTFKEISHRGLSIDYKFPPVACPEVVMQDCSLYCQDCLHLISPQAMVENHREHTMDDYKEVLAPMKNIVKESLRQSRANCTALQQKIQETQSLLQELDMNEEATIFEIARVFDLLVRKLKKREHELMTRMNQIVQEKRGILSEQLSTLSELHEDCLHAVKVAERLLHDTETNHDECYNNNNYNIKNNHHHQLHQHQQPSNNSYITCSQAAAATASYEGMYLVAATDTIEFRVDSLTEAIQERVSQFITVHPNISVHFVAEEAASIKSLAKCFGSIEFITDTLHTLTTAMPPSSPTATTTATGVVVGLHPQVEQVIVTSDSGSKLPYCHDNINNNSTSHIHSAVNSVNNSAMKGLLPKIRFAVKIRNEASMKYSSMKDKNISHNNNNNHQNNLAVGKKPQDNNKTNEFIIIEVRCIDTGECSFNPNNNNNGNGISSHSSSSISSSNGNNHNTNNHDSHDKHHHPGDVISDIGYVLGSIIVNTDIDRRLLNRHELHSYFESVQDDKKLPVLKIVKEFIPAVK